MANISNINDFFVVDSAGLKAAVGADLANGNGSPYVGTDFTVVGRDASSPVANLWLSNFTHKSYILISDNSSNFIIRDSAAGNRLTIDTNGNVGIGTDSPVSTWQATLDPSTGNSTFKLTSEGWIVTPYLTGLAGYYPGQGARPLIWGDIGGTNIQSWDNDAADGISLRSSNKSVRLFVREDGNVGIGTTSPSAKLEVAGNITTPTQDLSSTATPTNFGVYSSEIRLIDTPNGGLKQCRVITDNYGEWILVGRFAASAMNSIALANVWSSESGLDTGTAQNLATKFSADFGDSYPTEVRIMGATDFTKWRDTRTVDFIYGVPEGRPWKFFFSGGATNGMTLGGSNMSGNPKYGWLINGSYDGFGRWVNPAQNFVGMSDGNVTNPSAAFTTATTNAFFWDGADDAKITASATRPFSGQDSYVTTGFGNDDNIYGFFDEYPGETTNMQGGVDFSSATWVLIKLPNASSGGASNDYWSSDGTNIVNTNSGSVQIGTKPTITPNANFDQLVITGTVHSGITILSGTTSDGAIYFGDSAFNGAGQIKYFHNTNSMTFTTDNDQATITLDNQYLATFAGTIAGNAGNTTEVGTYPTGGIKRIRMIQGGEIHFGDTTVAAPLGVTEGTWDNFADQDLLSVYSRNSFRVYGYPSSTSELMRVANGGSWLNTSIFSIGSTGPINPAKLNVKTPGSALVETGLRLINPYGFGSTGCGVKIAFAQDRSDSENYEMAAIQSSQTSGGTSGFGNLSFYTRNNPNLTERLRIQSNGQSNFYGSIWATGYYITALQGNSQLTNASTSSGSLASYIGQGLISVSVSDVKAKENFSGVETNECLNKIVSLADHVKKFDWIDEDWKKEKGRTVGMVAQEIYEDHSEFVHKPENYDDDGWAIRYQEIVPTLIKAIQELKAEIEILKNK
jgi:hypothetical protein